MSRFLGFDIEIAREIYRTFASNAGDGSPSLGWTAKVQPYPAFEEEQGDDLVLLIVNGPNGGNDVMLDVVLERREWLNLYRQLGQLFERVAFNADAREE